MPDPTEVAAAVDNVIPDAQPAEETAAVAEETPQKSQELILGKFKDVAEVGKAYVSLEQKLSEMGSTISVLEREREEAKTQNQLADVLKTIATSKQAEDAPKARDFDSFATEIGEDFREDAPKATKKLMAAVAGWLNEDKSNTEKSLKGDISALKNELSTLASLMRESQDKSDPFYQQNRVAIDKMVTKGMPLAAAKELVKEVLEGADTPFQIRPPTTVAPRNVAPVKNVQKYLTQEERARFKSIHGLTDAELDDMEATERRNREQITSERS